MAVERLDVDSSNDRLQEALHRQRYQFVLSRLQQEDRVLEVGTGVGALSSELIKRCPSYIGVELDPAVCAEARKRTDGHAQILEANALDLPFSDSQFSLIICLEVLEHLGDWRRGVREIHRCMMPDGRALISVPFRRRGARSRTNQFHIYEPGQNELLAYLQKHFQRMDVFYQSFTESSFMTMARVLHIRRLFNLAHIYANLSQGKEDALQRVAIRSHRRGLKIGLLATLEGKKLL